jgi:predicted cobalt transporter CbtA
MGTFRSIVLSSVIAGFVVGVIVTVIQQFGTVPLILKAEVFEKAAEAHQGAAAAGGRSKRSPGIAIRIMGTPRRRGCPWTGWSATPTQQPRTC